MCIHIHTQQDLYSKTRHKGNSPEYPPRLSRVPHDYSSVLLPGDSPAAPRRYSHVSPVVGNSVELVPKTTTTTTSSNHLRFNPPT